MRGTTISTAGQSKIGRLARPSRRSSAMLLATVFAATATVTGCSASASEPEEIPTPSSAVLKPENPGDEVDPLSPEDIAEAQVPDDQWNDADAEFMTMMVLHHAQAMEMTDLVPARSDSEQLRTFSERMHLAQRGEIGYMTDWLEERELTVPEEARAVEDGEIPSTGSHDHGEAHMPGMLTEEEITALTQAEGEDFDRLFLEGMIKHHEGALEMSAGVHVTGEDLLTQELAGHIASDQHAEIMRLEDLLAEL